MNNPTPAAAPAAVPTWATLRAEICDAARAAGNAMALERAHPTNARARAGRVAACARVVAADEAMGVYAAGLPPFIFWAPDMAEAIASLDAMRAGAPVWL